jgi:hypothetical protein
VVAQDLGSAEGATGVAPVTVPANGNPLGLGHGADSASSSRVEGAKGVLAGPAATPRAGPRSEVGTWLRNARRAQVPPPIAVGNRTLHGPVPR